MLPPPEFEFSSSTSLHLRYSGLGKVKLKTLTASIAGCMKEAPGRGQGHTLLVISDNKNLFAGRSRA